MTRQNVTVTKSGATAAVNGTVVTNFVAAGTHDINLAVEGYHVKSVTGLNNEGKLVVNNHDVTVTVEYEADAAASYTFKAVVNDHELVVDEATKTMTLTVPYAYDLSGKALADLVAANQIANATYSRSWTTAPADAFSGAVGEVVVTPTDEHMGSAVTYTVNVVKAAPAFTLTLNYTKNDDATEGGKLSIAALNTDTAYKMNNDENAKIHLYRDGIELAEGSPIEGAATETNINTPGVYTAKLIDANGVVVASNAVNVAAENLNVPYAANVISTKPNWSVDQNSVDLTGAPTVKFTLKKSSGDTAELKDITYTLNGETGKHVTASCTASGSSWTIEVEIHGLTVGANDIVVTNVERA